MRFLLASVRKDCARLLRDAVVIPTWLGIPAVLVVLITAVFGGSGEAAPQGRLLIADEDGTPASKMVPGVFKRELFAKMFTVENVAKDEGRRRMDKGDASALLVIPAGFQNAFLGASSARIELITNPAQDVLPGIVKQAAAGITDIAFYMQRGAISPMEALAGGPSRTTSVDFHTQAAPRQSHNVAALFLPPMMFMGLLFVAQAYALDLRYEQAWGTLRRLATTPASKLGFLGGRVIALAAMMALIGLAGVAGMKWYARVPVANVSLAVAWVVLSGCGFYLLWASIMVRARDRRSAAVFANLVMFPLSLIGGTFFPFEMMPAWMASIGRFTPNGWSVRVFKSLVTGSANGAEFLVATAWLLAVGVLLFATTARGLRRL